MKRNPSTFFSWETLPTNCPLEDCVVALLYPVFPFTFPLDCSISVHGREILSSYQGLAPSSVPFGGISGYYPLRGGLGSEPTVRDAWSSLLALLLEADTIRCARGTSAGRRCLLGLWRDPGYKAPERDLWAWRQLLSKLRLRVRTVLLVGATKCVSNMGKPKSKIASWYLYSWRLGVWCWVRTICCYLLVLCPTWE